MAIINEKNYVERFRIKGHGFLNRDVWMVKSRVRNGKETGILNLYGLVFPKQFVGKKIMLKIEIVDEISHSQNNITHDAKSVAKAVKNISKNISKSVAKAGNKKAQKIGLYGLLNQLLTFLKKELQTYNIDIDSRIDR